MYEIKLFLNLIQIYYQQIREPLHTSPEILGDESLFFIFRDIGILKYVYTAVEEYVSAPEEQNFKEIIYLSIYKKEKELCLSFGCCTIF
jgi:hypothetical protein